jgi:hypothetical protein
MVLQKIKKILLKSDDQNLRFNITFMLAFFLITFLCFLNAAFSHVDFIDTSGVDIVIDEYFEDMKKTEYEEIIEYFEDHKIERAATDDEVEQALIYTYNE